MCDQTTSTDIRSATFSQALAAGHTHSGWLVGPTTGPSGQEAALVSHSVSPERAQALKTRVTSGPLFAGSSLSAPLQSCLASRLRALMDENGSQEYVLTWKHWDIRWGPRICALRGSARRTSGNGCGGWATPTSEGNPVRSEEFRKGREPSPEELLAGLPTPNAGPQNDTDTKWEERREECRERCSNGNGFGLTLGMASTLATGTPQIGTTAETASGGAYRLNPRFSLWLMGYPEEWAYCGARAMRSFIK